MSLNQAGRPSHEHRDPGDATRALQDEIAQTRADLGDTLTELGARTNVKARTKRAVAKARGRAKDAVQEQANSATFGSAWVAGSGVTSMRRLLDRFGRRPASIAVGTAASVLTGLFLYVLLRRRGPLRSMAPARSVGGARLP